MFIRSCKGFRGCVSSFRVQGFVGFTRLDSGILASGRV